MLVKHEICAFPRVFILVLCFGAIQCCEHGADAHTYTHTHTYTHEHISKHTMCSHANLKNM
jgi:hypothetical protein